jgi:molybdate transport system substrate-binding protein
MGPPLSITTSDAAILKSQETKSLSLGVVALSLALSPNMKNKGRYGEIPTTEYPPIEQACVILSSSKDKETAKQFLSYIKTAAVSDTLKRYGFGVANSSHEKP